MRTACLNCTLTGRQVELGRGPVELVGHVRVVVRTAAGVAIGGRGVERRVGVGGRPGPPAAASNSSAKAASYARRGARPGRRRRRGSASPPSTAGAARAPCRRLPDRVAGPSTVVVDLVVHHARQRLAGGHRIVSIHSSSQRASSRTSGTPLPRSGSGSVPSASAGGRCGGRSGCAPTCSSAAPPRCRR